MNNRRQTKTLSGEKYNFFNVLDGSALLVLDNANRGT